MLPCFEVFSEKKDSDEGCETEYICWKNKTFFDKKFDNPILKSTALQCDSMTPAERSNEDMAKKYLQNKIEIIERSGFEVIALYRYITKFKRGIDSKGNKKDDIYTWRIEVWNKENKDAVGNIPVVKPY